MWYWRFRTCRKLNRVVCSDSLFIRSLIVITRKILYAVYINAKWIHASKTLACTIRECAIVRNVLYARTRWTAGVLALANVRRLSTVLLNQNPKSIANRDWSKEVKLEGDLATLQVHTSIRLALDPNDRDPWAVPKSYICIHITRIRTFNSIWSSNP